MLPVAILKQAQAELLDWHDLGMSVMEISHRSKAFLAIAEEAEQNLRDLLAIPANFHVLFLQGGARSQFSMIPLNLLATKRHADYIDTGLWSTLAIKEAERYATVNVVATARDQHYLSIPDESTWQLNEHSAYCHYVDNETINGVEFSFIPNSEQPLVSDMSSNILSRPFDVSRFGVIYAGAQKNVSCAGLTLVIIRQDLVGQALSFTPSMFNYQYHVQERSMYNTPPTFAWYLAGLTFKWLKLKGGLAHIAQESQQKSSNLYRFIDATDFYINRIDKRYRSRMNVVFNLADESLNDLFLLKATENGLTNLKGHKLVGGMRASLYNGMPLEGVECLISFMQHFSQRYG